MQVMSKKIRISIVILDMYIGHRTQINTQWKFDSKSHASWTQCPRKSL